MKLIGGSGGVIGWWVVKVDGVGGSGGSCSGTQNLPISTQLTNSDNFLTAEYFCVGR